MLYLPMLTLCGGNGLPRHIAGGLMAFEKGKCVVRISDVSEDVLAVALLAVECNKGQLALSHLPDAIEDFLP